MEHLRGHGSGQRGRCQTKPASLAQLPPVMVGGPPSNGKAALSETAAGIQAGAKWEQNRPGTGGGHFCVPLASFYHFFLLKRGTSFPSSLLSGLPVNVSPCISGFFHVGSPSNSEQLHNPVSSPRCLSFLITILMKCYQPQEMQI